MNLFDVVYVSNGLSKEKFLSMMCNLNQKTPKTNRPKKGYLRSLKFRVQRDIKCSLRQSFWLVAIENQDEYLKKKNYFLDE